MRLRQSRLTWEKAVSRKRLILLLAGGALLIMIVIALLAIFSGRILKDRIQRALGPHVQVGNVSLSWDGVELSDIILTRDTHTVARAKRVVLRAKLLGVFGQGYKVSRVVIDDPVVTLTAAESDGIGRLISAHTGKGTAGGPPMAGKPISIGRIEIKNGSFAVEVSHLPSPGVLSAVNFNLTLDDVDYPSSNKKSKLTVESRFEGSLLSGRVACRGFINLETAAVDLKLDAADIRGADAAGAGPQLRAKAITLRIQSGEDVKGVLLSDVMLKEPYVVLTIDRRGDLVLPVRLPPEKPKAREPGPATTRVFISNLSISGGEVLVFDGKVSRPPHQLRYTDMQGRIDRVSIPAALEWSSYILSAKIPRQASTGTLDLSGKTMFSTTDTDAKLVVKDLDLTSLRPYIYKQGDTEVAAGQMDLTLDATVRQRHIRAPARAIIRNLAFAPARTVKDRFLGVPRAAVINYMKSGSNDIVLNFTVEGNIDDPKFTSTDAMATRFALGLAKTLGVDVFGVGETILRQGGRTIEGIGRGLRDATGGASRRVR